MTYNVFSGTSNPTQSINQPLSLKTAEFPHNAVHDKSARAAQPVDTTRACGGDRAYAYASLIASCGKNLTAALRLKVWRQRVNQSESYDFLHSCIFEVQPSNNNKPTS